MSQKGTKQLPSSPATVPGPGVQLHYQTTTGRTPVLDYLDDLNKKDLRASRVIRESLTIIESKGYIYEPGGGPVKLEGGADIHQLDKDKNTKGHRLSEIRYHRGGGQRVYLLEHDGHVVVLDGAKKPPHNEQTQDIRSAADRATDWVKRYKKGEFAKEIDAKRAAMAPPAKVTPIREEPSTVKSAPADKGITPPEGKPSPVPEKAGGAPDWRARLNAHNAEMHAKREKAGARGRWAASLAATALVLLGLGREEKAEAQELPLQPSPETSGASPFSTPPVPSPSASSSVPPQRAFEALSPPPALMQESPASPVPPRLTSRPGSPAGPQ